jgi:DNA-binding response OmpR family regulator
VKLPRGKLFSEDPPVPRILIVDDEPLISMLVEGWLKELGCEVVGPARSVQDGLDLVDRSLDGAILDVNLAGESSLSLANALRLKGIPVAFATGDSGLDEDSGFADQILLNKPFVFEEVKAVVSKLLEPPAP